MSHWNIRIIYHDKGELPWYGVHEVYYDDNENIYTYATEAESITGETIDEVKEYLEMIQKDINNSPILIESEIHCTMDDEDIDNLETMTLEELEKEFGKDE